MFFHDADHIQILAVNHHLLTAVKGFGQEFFEKLPFPRLELVVIFAVGFYRGRVVANLLEQDDQSAWNLERFQELMRFSYGRKYLQLLSWVDEVASAGRERQKSFLEYALRLVRENFISNLKREDLVYMNPNERNFSDRFSPFINERNVIPLSNEIETAFRDIAMNGNAKIILTDLTLKIIKMIRA